MTEYKTNFSLLKLTSIISSCCTDKFMFASKFLRKDYSVLNLTFLSKLNL